MNDRKKLRCAVIGAGGFIGTNLCRRLAGNVEVLHAFGRSLQFPDAFKEISWYSGDLLDPTRIYAAIDGCDTVFHLVSATTPSSANLNMIADIQTNVIPTLHLLEACRLLKVRRVIYASSGGTIYGIPREVPISENAPTSPLTAYGISKLAIEKYLALYEKLYNLEYRVLRIANPYGPFQTGLKNQGIISVILQRAMASKPVEIWGDGTVVRDYIYVDDVIDAFELAALHEGPSRCFNIGSGEGYSINALIERIGAVLGSDIAVQYRESRPVDIPCNILDISLAKYELDWTPRTVQSTGLERTAKWMLNRLSGC